MNFKYDSVSALLWMTDITSVILQKMARPMKCRRCAHQWFYTGKNEYVVSCRHCRTTVSIRKYNKLQAGSSLESPSQSVVNPS